MKLNEHQKSLISILSTIYNSVDITPPEVEYLVIKELEKLGLKVSLEMAVSETEMTVEIEMKIEEV